MRFARLILSGVLALPAFADESSSALIQALGDEAPAVRDSAQAELERRGESVAGDLERALGSPEFPDAEIQARLREMVGRARRAEAWEHDPGPLAVEEAADVTCATCKDNRFAVESEVTDDAFREVVEGAKLFRVRCARCTLAGKGPQAIAILFLKKSGGRVLLRQGHVSRLIQIAALLRAVTSPEEARDAAAALVAIGRITASLEFLEAARKSARVEQLPAGGFRVILNDCGDDAILEFDAAGRLAAASRADG